MMGKRRHPQARRLMITADGGGSNGYRVRLWKTELQRLANELRLPITVCHMPPGTSKWNKIEHRLFSFITINWRGKPLRSFRTIVQLIQRPQLRLGLRFALSWTRTNIQKVSRFRTPNWPPSISSATRSTATGITRSCRPSKKLTAIDYFIYGRSLSLTLANFGGLGLGESLRI
jgi:Rhodopirellula transposase DDE domain